MISEAVNESRPSVFVSAIVILLRFPSRVDRDRSVGLLIACGRLEHYFIINATRRAGGRGRQIFNRYRITSLLLSWGIEFVLRILWNDRDFI